MFAFHETTRKRICRTAFFALCLAPTCATAAWIADHHLPWRTAAAARRLSDRYHLDVALSDLQAPRPRTTRTAALTLAAPGAPQPLAKLADVETRRRGDVLLLTTDQLSLTAADLPALAARLQWILARTDAAKIEFHAAAARLQLANQDAAVELFRLRAAVERTPDGQPRLRAVAHLSATPKPGEKPLTLALEPAATPADSPSASADAATGAQSPDEPPATAAVPLTVTLDTQQQAIPVALLAPLVPGAAALNPDATFVGLVTWKFASESSMANPASRGALRGTLHDVELDQALPAGSPHQLSGRATVELTECRWQGERFERLAGSLTSTGAAANGSFLAAAPSYLACPPGEALKPTLAAASRVAERLRTGQEPPAEDLALLEETHQLDHFACRFALDATGLAIEPHIPAASTLPAGTLAASEDDPVLFVPRLPEATRLPAVAWLQFVASPPPAWIPFTPATLETARRLPLK